MKRKPIILVFGGVVALALILSLAIIPRVTESSGASVNGEFPAAWFAPGTDEELAAQAKLVGKPMPPLTLTQWQNGQVNPEDLKGKVVVIDFWSTWCAACIAAFPANNDLYAKYKPQGLEFIGVCTNSAQENFLPIIADKKPQYPMARDESLETMKAWSALTYPVYTVIDRKGLVRAMGLKHEYIEAVVKKLIAESP